MAEMTWNMLVLVPEYLHQPYDDDVKEEAYNINYIKSLF